MDTLEKAELTASIRHIAIFLKSRIPIYNFEVPDRAGRKREEGEHRQLRSVTHFTETQKICSISDSLNVQNYSKKYNRTIFYSNL